MAEQKVTQILLFEIALLLTKHRFCKGLENTLFERYSDWDWDISQKHEVIKLNLCN